jgi:prephenate dehydratase
LTVADGALRVAYLGPEGTFSEEALLASTERGSIEPIAEPTVFDCVMAVQEGRVERTLVPIENSLEGSVSATLDTLAFETEGVSIVGELVHPIRNCLIARKRIPLDRIERVLSHPQANAQCSRFIRERLPRATVMAADSTADAVRIVAATDLPWAALGNRLSAELYGCEVLEAGVENIAGNETRFVWLARERLPAEGPGPWKTSIIFWGMSDAPGALVQVLQAFAEHDINLTKIESRPLKLGLGRYVFFADLEGHEQDEEVADAFKTVRARVKTLRVIGSYPAASR